MIENSPIKKPFFYDRKEGIDHFTKILIEENPKKLSDKEKQDIHKLGQEMKKDALDRHVKEVKQMDNLDPNTYPSNPKVRGQLLEISTLEKDLAANNINNPKFNKPVKKRNYFDDTVKLNVGNKGPLKLPELNAEEIERANRPSDWDVIYGSMSPFEKGQWNNEQRRKKLKDQKEEAEDKAAEELTPSKKTREVIYPKIEVPSVKKELFKKTTQPEPQISIEQKIRDMADQRLLNEQRAWDNRNGRGGLVEMLRPK